MSGSALPWSAFGKFGEGFFVERDEVIIRTRTLVPSLTKHGLRPFKCSELSKITPALFRRFVAKSLRLAKTSFIPC